MTATLALPASGAAGGAGRRRGRASAALHLMELRDQQHGMVALVAAGGLARRLSPSALWARAAVMTQVHALFGGSTALIGFNGRAESPERVAVPRLPLAGSGRAPADGITARAQGRLEGIRAAAARTLALGAVTPGPLERGSVPGLGELGAPGLWPAFDLAWSRAARADGAVRRLREAPAVRAATLERAGRVLDHLGALAPSAASPDDDEVRDAIAAVAVPGGMAPEAAARVAAACLDAAAAGLLWEMMASGADRVPGEWAAVLLVLTGLADEAGAAA